MLIEKYGKRFESIRQQFNQLESDYLLNCDFPGLIQQIIQIYKYENCERESDRAALDELKEYVGSMPMDQGVSPLREFLSDLNLSGSQMDSLIQKMKKVPIITVHQSKGCEFDTVIIIEAIDNVFPSYRSVQEGREEEERRIFYVAISRAKKKLIIISPIRNNPARPDKISRYMQFIPNQYIDSKHWKV